VIGDSWPDMVGTGRSSLPMAAPDGDSWLTIAKTPLPPFCVSGASKGVSQAVSLLFATLAGRGGCINVATEGLKAIKGGDPDRVGAGVIEAAAPAKVSES